MFTMPKTTFNRYYHAFSNTVVERLGNYSDNEGIFLIDDLGGAKSFANEKQETVLKNKIWLLNKTLSNGKWLKYHIRSLWDKQTAKALKNHYEKIKMNNALLMGQYTGRVSVEPLPDDISFEGEKLEIGAIIYFVNTHDSTLTEVVISGYAATMFNKNELIYLNKEGTYATHLTVDKKGTNIYSNKEDAENALKELIKKQMADLAEKSKKIGK